MQAFQKSIKAIKLVSQILPNTSRMTMNPRKELLTRMLPVKDNCCPVCFGERVEGLQNTLYYTFDRAIILIPPSHQLIDDEIEFFLYLATMVMLFNLALTTHLSAIKHGKSHSLQYAMKLYYLVETMVNDGDVFGNVGEMMKWLTMNNVACLHIELCDYEKFAIDQQFLRKALKDDVMVDRCTTMLFEGEELNELMLNFFCFHVPIAAHAA